MKKKSKLLLTIETYKATVPAENHRAYLAVLRFTEGCSMHFYGPTEPGVRGDAQAWFDGEVAKEKERAAKAAERKLARAK